MSTTTKATNAGAVRLVITDESGAEQCRCTAREFVRANVNVMRPAGRWVARIVAGIAERGAVTLNLGCCGVFTLRAE